VIKSKQKLFVTRLASREHQMNEEHVAKFQTDPATADG
jgi:hypothetical protein